ncbi:MAG: hypothetical protein FWH07_04810 [Oscillospiraceae bacterium]|nr:hypothetical protein [Oscillospiraceae bacterium]
MMITTESNKLPNKIPRKPREEAVQIVTEELKSMMWTFIVLNGITLIICAVYSVVDSFDWRFLTGLVAGNAASLLNFYHLGVKAGKILRRKDIIYAKRYSKISFICRYLGGFAAFGILITLGAINAITAMIPLFFPKIHYYFKAVFNKNDKIFK